MGACVADPRLNRHMANAVRTDAGRWGPFLGPSWSCSATPGKATLWTPSPKALPPPPVYAAFPRHSPHLNLKLDTSSLKQAIRPLLGGTPPPLGGRGDVGGLAGCGTGGGGYRRNGGGVRVPWNTLEGEKGVMDGKDRVRGDTLESLGVGRGSGGGNGWEGGWGLGVPWDMSRGR